MAVLYSYGMPPSIQALAAFLEEQERSEAREIYTGNMIWTLLRVVGKNIQIPSLSELMHEEYVQDHRTGHEIMQDLIVKLKR